MKALFYKTHQSMGLYYLLMLYLIFFIPLSFTLDDMNSALTSPFVYTLSGVIYIILINSDVKSRFDKYIISLPISRKSYISYIFITTILYNVLMFFVLTGFTVVLAHSNGQIYELFTVFKLFSSMAIALAITGFAMLIAFKFNFTASWILYIFLYFVSSFVSGFFQGILEDTIHEDLFKTPIFCAVSAVTALAVLSAEWVFSVKIYNKKDL